jgi:hypothetical protein
MWGLHRAVIDRVRMRELARGMLPSAGRVSGQRERTAER